MLELIISLISGALGGNIAGGLLKNFNLGPIGNSIAGIIGGGLGGQILSAITGGASQMADTAGAAAGGLDLGTIISQVAGGGVGGAVLMVIVGLVKRMLSNP